MEASDEVDDAFPDALREPILRKVQFSQISRIDNLGKILLIAGSLHATLTYVLVDHVYDV